jgi:hypothetical protein
MMSASHIEDRRAQVMNVASAARSTANILGCPRAECQQPVLCTTVCAQKPKTAIQPDERKTEDCPVCGPHPSPGIRDEGCFDPRYDCPRVKLRYRTSDEQA